ncbi:hypothetical protein AQ913_22465 [Burkholderia pseudomallei]|uniref:hypothetical protein n=1 Tax=Burkholderia pseudomallei TaxID=28450 RepID=UPI000976339F|nr:hypothetical protein [Burkholderia pseudomallei]ONC17983.1 hypothetical protein AQ913_22465 [Burkholderia pseudomallei]
MASNFSGAQGFLQNPLIATLSPDQQQNLLQLQQRQAVGQALLAQGLQPADYGGANIGGLAYHVSPLNGISKLLNAYVGNKLSMDSMGQQAQLMGQMYGNAFGTTPGSAAAAPSDAGGQSVDIPPPAAADTGELQGPSAGLGLTQPTPVQLGQAMGAPAPRATAPMAGPMTLPGKTPQESMLLYSMLGPEGYARVAAAWGAPTDATRMALAGGLDPAAANRDALFKANYLPPVQIGANTTVQDPRSGTVTTTPAAAPAGAQNILGADGKWYTVPVTGGTQAIRAERAANELGAGDALPAAPQYDKYGNPKQTMSRSASLAGNATGAAAPTLSQIFAAQESSGGKTAPDNPFQIQKSTFDRFAQPGESWNNVADRNAVAQRMLAKFNQDYGGDLGRIATAYFSGEGNVAPAGSPTPFIKNVSDSNGKSVASYVSDILGRAGRDGAAPVGGGNYPVQAPGVVASANAAATNQQGELSKKWSDLTAQNQQAQSVISNLQNIKTLAGKAIVGPQSDRLAYANSLLALAGSERATDMTTANDLLNKYSNQITARLGQGGMGTDAARAILQSAYPNSHMTQGAINEAADNLIGAQQMVQAKARVLAPLRNANDAAGYTNAELTFDQNADPRIFQYTGIKDPVARAVFAKNLIAQDPGIVGKIQALQQLGALK